MSNIKIITSKGEIELDKELGFGVVYSADDLSDITKKNTPYSKTILAPATKSNNILFGNLFDVNSTFTVFNPNFKLDAKLVVNDTVVIEGYVQLLEIKKLNNTDLQGNKIQYSIKISDNVVDFYSSIKNKNLNDLDFSRYNHSLTKKDITDSWNNKEGYVYPLFFNNTNQYETKDFKPSIFHKTYLKQIASEAGFSLGGSFMDNPTYVNEIIPFNGGIVSISTEEKERRGFTALSNIVNTWDTNEYKQYFQRIETGYIPFAPFNAATDPNQHFDNATSTWSPDRNGSYNLRGNVKFKIEWDSKGVESYQYIGGGDVNVDVPMYGQVIVYKNNSVLEIFTTTFIIPRGEGTGSTFNEDNDYKRTSEYSINLDLENLDLAAGDTINFRTRVNSSALNVVVYAEEYSGSGTYNFTTIDMDFNSVEASFLEVTANPNVVVDGDPVDLSSYIPNEVKQSIILDDIIKRYNLIITTDSENSRKILLETRDDYYGRGDIIDWTDKKDYSNQDSIKLLSDLQNKEMLFSYTKGKDDSNEEYTETLNGDKIYGEKKVIFNNDFLKGETKVTTPFIPTPLDYNSPDKDFIVSMINTEEPGGKLRVLYYGGLTVTLNSSKWYFKSTDDNGVASTSNYTIYPYAGHFNRPYTPTVDLNFAVNDFYNYNELVSTTNNTSYNRYWSNTTRQLLEGRLVTSKFLLNEVDIAYIKANMNAKVFVKDSYYRINKIVDYNPLKEGLTKVELSKIVDGIAYEGEETPWIPKEEPKSPIKRRPFWRYWSTYRDYNANNINSIDSLTYGRGNNIGAYSNNSFTTGNFNWIGSYSPSSTIMGGDNNTIESNSVGASIFSSTNSTITAQATNSFIVGATDKVVDEPNTIALGNSTIINDTEFKFGDSFSITQEGLTVNNIIIDGATFSGVTANNGLVVLDGVVELGGYLDNGQLIGGKLNRNTIIDGDEFYDFNIINTNGVNIQANDNIEIETNGELGLVAEDEIFLMSGKIVIISDAPTTTKGVEYHYDYSMDWVGATPDSILTTKGYVDRTVSGGIINVDNTLTSTSVTDALSANQGRVLNDKILALEGSLIPQGNWDALNNVPDISTNSTVGYYWIVSVDGATNLDGITDWKVNDWAIKTATGWSKIDNTDKVTSVNGVSGDVELDADDIETFVGSGITVLDALNDKADSTELDNYLLKTKEAVGLQVIDTRSDNEDPSFYFGKVTKAEFKFTSIILLPDTSATYCSLETIGQWSGSSGGYSTQIAKTQNGSMYQRVGTSDTTWSTWKKLSNEDDLGNYLPLAGGTLTGELNASKGMTILDKTGEVISIGNTNLSSTDAWIRMGNGAYDWNLKYIGSTSGQDGNEFQLLSDESGAYTKTDHLMNVEWNNGTKDVMKLDGTTGKLYLTDGIESELGSLGRATNYKVTDMPFTSIASYHKRVIPLILKSSTNESQENMIQGEIQIYKTGGNVYDSYEVNGSSCYNSSYMTLTTNGQRTTSKLVQFTYQGVTWIGIEVGYSANPHHSAQFKGFAKVFDDSYDQYQLDVVSYYNENTSTVINSEINNSLVPYTGVYNVTKNFNNTYFGNSSNADTEIRMLEGNQILFTRPNANYIGTSNPSGYLRWRIAGDTKMTLGTNGQLTLEEQLNVASNVILDGYINNKSGYYYSQNTGGNKFIADKAKGFFAWNVNGSSADVMRLSSNGQLTLTEQLNANGGVIGNASSATKLAFINTDFVNEYPLTMNVNGTIYSNSSIKYKGSTDTLTVPNIKITDTLQVDDTLTAPNVKITDTLLLENDSNSGMIVNPGGGYYHTTSNVINGALTIRLPLATVSESDMISFKVRVYDYAYEESFEVLISGYSYGASNTWNNTTSIINTTRSDKNYKIRFGTEDGSNRRLVMIGETNSTWSYPQVQVHDFCGGYSCDIDKWKDGWDVYFTNSTSGISFKYTTPNNLPISKNYGRRLEIGNWNMTSAFRYQIIHNEPLWEKIVVTSVSIYDDTETILHQITFGGSWEIDSEYITIERFGDGYFDNTNFNSTTIKRGYIDYYITQ